MNDLEERLRDGLREFAEPVASRVSVEAVLAQGESLRNRRKRWVIGTVAIVLVAGLVGAGALARRPVAGVPAPIGTPTVSASPVPSGSAASQPPGYFDLSGMEMNRSVVPYASVTFSVVDGEVTVVARDRDRKVADQVRFRADGGAVLRSLGTRVTVGVVPDRVEWLDVVMNKGIAGGLTHDEHELPGLGMTAFVIVAEKEQKDGVPPVKGVVWRAADGTVRSSSGRTVESATLELSGGEMVVYRDPGLEYVSFSEDGRAGWTGSWDDGSEADVVKVDVSSTSSSEGSEQLAIGLLPRGASDPHVVLRARGELATGALQPGGRVVFVAQVRSSQELHGTLVKSVTYTDASGKQVTWRR